MTGKTIVITGASDGIGAAAARQLCRRGEKVIVVGRSETKTTALASELDADFFVADFAELSQVRDLAQQLRSRYTRIDVLANNAGVMTFPVQHTDDGFEKTYQIDYLAPFLLTTSLLDVLLDSRGAVINTSSASHRLLRRFTPADLENTARYRPSKAYALAKLGIMLFTKELHRRYHACGLSTAAFDPGYVNTNLGAASGSRFLAVMYRTPVRRLTSTADQAADQLVWLSNSRPGVDWKSGEYYLKRRIAKTNRLVYDAELGRELWDRTLAVVNR